MINPLQQFDAGWLILAAMLVFLAQFGFACWHLGINQSRHHAKFLIQAISNVVLACLLFWLVGFGLLHWQNPLALDSIGSIFMFSLGDASTQWLALFLFQAMLVCVVLSAVVNSIPSGISCIGRSILGLVVSIAAFPIAAQWVWYNGTESGWLRQQGYMDFAGTTVLHGVAGWSILACKIERKAGPLVNLSQPKFSPIAMLMGLALLLISWIGIHTGAALIAGDNLASVILCTLSAAISGALVAAVISRFQFLLGTDPALSPLRGCLAGLVAIGGVCHTVDAVAAVSVGAVAAVIMMLFNHWLVRRRLDDPAGVTGIFIGAGGWGALAVAFYTAPEQWMATHRMGQFGFQLLGIFTIALWSFLVTYLLLKILRRLRLLDNPSTAELVSGKAEFTGRDDNNPAALRYNRVLSSIESALGRCQAIVRDTHVAVVTFNADGAISSVNPAAEKLFGIAVKSMVGCSVQSLFFRDRKIRADNKHRLLGLLELNQTIEMYGLREGQSFPLEVTVTQGEYDGQQQFIALMRDIQSQKQVREQLIKEQKQALVTLSSIADGVITTDEQGKITYLNPAAERQTGWDVAQARRCPFDTIFNTADARDRIASQLQKVLTGKTLSDDFNQATLISHSGSEQPVSYTLAPIKDQFGDTFGCVAVFHDVTSTQALQRRLSYQATHDDLTGVLNRNGFEAEAQKLLNRSASLGEQHVLGFMDLDQFKTVNDTCGHQAGDELLRQIAQLIKRQLRSDDTLARMGGDEFCILLQNCNEDNGLHIAEIIRDAIAAYRFSWEGKQFSVGASIGLVKITRETPSLSKLMGLADSACYAAKDEGRNRVNVYRPNDLELAERRGQVEWISKIRQALDTDALRLFYQPIELLQGAPNQPQHIEVFVHLLGENGKLVPPGAFIPAAERYSVIQEVDMWVVRHALAWLNQYQQQTGNHDMVCSINLSGTTISDKQSLERIIAIIENSQVVTSGVCFEITETAAIGNFEAAKRFIVALKEKGCSFSLDDFGSGLSSFGYLKNLPVDYLKIDGVFIKDILNNRVDRVMVDSITKLAHELGLKTIAEFVSSQAIADQLRELDVDYAQGYFLARPKPLEQLLSSDS